MKLKELRQTVNQATDGALDALRKATEYNHDPHITCYEEGGWTRLIFWATDQESGQVKYFDSVLTPTEDWVSLVQVMETVREAKKQTAQIRLGLARLSMGLDPEGASNPALN